MSATLTTTAFQSLKDLTLNNLAAGIDYSYKGSIDKPIVELVSFLNNLHNYYTTSSCSGRISVFENGLSSKQITWLLVKHRIIETIELIDAVRNYSSREESSISRESTGRLVLFKCESFILHIHCRSIDSAKEMHDIATSCGFRESGIKIGTKKIILAIRSTANCMELPIASDGRLLVDDPYLQLLVQEANSRLITNFYRIERFLLALKAHWQWPLLRCIRHDDDVSRSSFVRRWGHSVCSSHPSTGNECLVIGGYGSEMEASRNGSGGNVGGGGNSVCKRGLSTLSLRIDIDGSIPKMLNVIDDSMHAVAVVVELGLDKSASNCRSLLIISGGRRSPAEALSCLRMFDIRQDYSPVQPLIHFGDEPVPRWGHSLSQVHSGRYHCTFFLLGGRDDCRVFDDSFLLQIQLTSTGSILCVWKKVVLHVPEHIRTNDHVVDDDDILSPRCFHSASTTPHVFPSTESVSGSAEDIPDMRCDGSWRTNDGGVEDDWVMIHGGITSLDCPTTTSSLCVVDTSTGEVSDLIEPSVGEGIDHQAGDSIRFVYRFGHTLTAIGAKSFLLLGGASLCSNCSASNQDDNPSIVIDLYINASGRYKSKLRRIYVTTNNDHAIDTISEHKDSSILRSQLPCQACRIHHQAILHRDDGNGGGGGESDRRNKRCLLVTGGGAMTLAFGPHFCCDLRLWLLTNEEDNDRVEESLLVKTDQLSSHNSNNVPMMLNNGLKQISQRHGGNRSAHTGCMFLPTFLVRSMKVCLEAMGYLDKSRGITRAVDDWIASTTVIAVDRLGTSHGFELPSVMDVLRGYDALRRKKSEDEDSVAPSVMAIPITQDLYNALLNDDQLSSIKLIPALLQRNIDIGYMLLGIHVQVHHSAPGLGTNQSSRPRSGVERAKQFLQALSDQHGLPLISNIETTGPSGTHQHVIAKQSIKFEIVGDIVMLPEGCLVGPEWVKLLAAPYREETKEMIHKATGDGDGSSGVDDNTTKSYGSYVFRSVAECFGFQRVARKATIDAGPKRESRVRLLYPEQGQPVGTGPGAAGWVTLVENRIRFSFDITRVMFCSGNVTERMRMGRITALDEVVVDLYCGIGYYSLPLLVHGHAAHVHACEWNENSLLALKENLIHADMLQRCTIHEGDNQITSKTLVDIADRVLLVAGWLPAVRALRRTGGIIHVHENVLEADLAEWMEDTRVQFEECLAVFGKSHLSVAIDHLEKVKSYAPRVYHIVLDLSFRER